MRAGRDIVASGTPLGQRIQRSQSDQYRMPRSPATSSSTTTLTTSRWSRPAATSSTATSTSPAPVPWRSAPGATFSWRIARRSPVSARWCRATAGRVPISCSGRRGGGRLSGLPRALPGSSQPGAGRHPLAEQPGKVVRTYESELAKWLNERFGFAGDAEQAQAFFAGLPAEQQRIFARQGVLRRTQGRRPAGVQRSRRGYARVATCAGATRSPRCSPSAIRRTIRSATKAISSCMAVPALHTDFGGDIQLLSPGGCQVFGHGARKRRLHKPGQGHHGRWRP